MTALPTILDADAKPSSYWAQYATAMASLGVTRDNAGRPFLAPSLAPIPVALGVAGESGVGSTVNYTVAAGKWLIVTEIGAAPASGSITVTPSGGGALSVI